MASDCSTSSTSAPPKSKQERIRDNQRRSRARRQEYLADLEQRLKECHVACREAELQRSAFADLQVENARLRDLLNYAGVSANVIEGFSRQSIPRHGVDAGAAHRQIKPKYQPPAPARHSDPATMMRQASTPESHTTLPPDSPSIYGVQHAVSFVAPPATDAMSLSSPADASQNSSYGWAPRSHNRMSMQVPFCCETFSIPATGPLLADNGNTVQCSVAKMMIDEYNPAPREMEEIKARLATGFSLPRSSEPCCRVNTQLVFGILQEMNSRDLHG